MWLCPKKHTELYEKLETVMASLQTLFPGTPPSFEPHVTISTNIDIALDDPEKRHDDVDRILGASVAALQSIPATSTNSPLVRLGRVGTQRSKYKKLYFEVAPDANLLSFAQIIRELFVVLPQLVERENQLINPHLYTADNHGNRIRRAKLRSSKRASSTSEKDSVPTKQISLQPLQNEASSVAAQWSKSEFFPHLSMVYSEVYPIGSAMWRTITTRIQDYLGIDNCNDPVVEDTGLGWNGGVLKLVLCRGDPQDWIELGSVDV